MPFTTTPWSIIAIIAAYLFFVNDFGRNLMKDRKPFELKTIINIYNIIQIFANAYLVYKITVYTPKLKNATLFCIPDPRGDDSEAAFEVLHGHYVYLIIKIVDLLDTV